MVKRKTEAVKTRDSSVIGYFMQNPEATNAAVSAGTGVSASTVQRILSDPDYSELEIPKNGNTISQQLIINKKRGLAKGGKTTFERYDAVKGEGGIFIGLTPTDEEDKEQKKNEQITAAVLMFSRYPNITTEELAELLEHDSRDIVYDLLTDPRVYDIFGSVMAKAITERLEYNAYSILKKLPIGFTIHLLEEVPALSEREKEIIRLRLGDGEAMVSAEEVAGGLGISRSMVLKIENRAATKITLYFGSTIYRSAVQGTSAMKR